MSAGMMFQPCFLAVEMKPRMVAKSFAPCSDRKPPEIFLELRHAHVLLGLIVGEGHGEVGEEA